MRVVALGAYDSLDLAQGFARRHDMRAAKAVWDEKGTSWAFYGVMGQPASVLVGTDGRIVGRWTGLIDTAKVSTAIKRAAPQNWPPKR